MAKSKEEKEAAKAARAAKKAAKAGGDAAGALGEVNLAQWRRAAGPGQHGRSGGRWPGSPADRVADNTCRHGQTRQIGKHEIKASRQAVRGAVGSVAARHTHAGKVGEEAHGQGGD